MTVTFVSKLTRGLYTKSEMNDVAVPHFVASFIFIVGGDVPRFSNDEPRDYRN